MNSVQLAQLRGMMVYEFRMHWRRRALVIVMLAMLVILLFMMAVLGNSMQESSGLDLELMRRAASATIIMTTWAPIAISLALILPVMVADTIPLDQQYGVRDTLNSLPLSYPVYLAGKLLGVWSAVLAGLLGIMIFTAVAWRVFSGPYDVAIYLEMWVVGVFWIAILNSGIGVLISATQPNRRRAILLVICFLVISISLLSGSLQGADWKATFSPMRDAIINYYLYNGPQSAGMESMLALRMVRPESFVLTIVVGLLELVIIGAGAVAWTRYQENKA